jgi:hypothetical protein
MERETFQAPDPFVRERSTKGDATIEIDPARIWPSAPSKRMQEMLDRKRNWMFMVPEDLAPTPSLEDKLELPDLDDPTQDKKAKGPSLERFLKNQDKIENPGQKGGPNDKNNNPNTTDPNRSDEDSQWEDEDRTGKSKDLDRNRDFLKRLESVSRDTAGENGEPDNSGKRKAFWQEEFDRSGSSFFSNEKRSPDDMFGLKGDSVPSSMTPAASKARLDEFKKLLSMPTPATSAGTKDFSSSASSLAGDPTAGFGAMNSPLNLDTPALGGASVRPGAAALPNLSGASYDATRMPAAMQPRFPEPEQKPLLIPSPTFTAPRRQF